jgi:hypothetical protein
MVELSDPMNIESDVSKVVIYSDGSMDAITLKIGAGKERFIISTASGSLKTVIGEDRIR